MKVIAATLAISLLGTELVFAEPPSVTLTPNIPSNIYINGSSEQDMTYTHTEKRTVLAIHPDGTITFFDKDGNKIRDYDPGAKERKPSAPVSRQINLCIMDRWCPTKCCKSLNNLL